MMIVHLIFWIWYSIGAVLLLFFGVPESLNFSNGLFLVFYGYMRCYLVERLIYLRMIFQASQPTEDGMIACFGSQPQVFGLVVWE
ncbi:hypothetical protein [Paenibacillus pini]|uniref:Uncharacterized protein n=1 Tax=Paenibacillus pini JCM 16418 TaxID=1236976 RepID=W7YP13_9BACL|nr:hypothetical protein [Paenibacillus pini]GAF10167.1 hypothetical protein JCM16418_4344 [Paenibacillus pini JCM 16418]